MCYICKTGHKCYICKVSAVDPALLGLSQYHAEMTVMALPKEKHRLVEREALVWRMHPWDHPEGNHNK